MQMETDDLRGAAQTIRLASIPQRQQHMAVTGNEDAGPGVLLVAGWAVTSDLFVAVARAQRQREQFGLLQLLFEHRPACGAFEIVAIQRHRQRQRRHHAQAEIEGNLCHQLVAAFGQRRQQGQRQVGVALLQLEEEVAYSPLQCGNIATQANCDGR